MANAPLLGVALAGTGSHPAAWPSPGAADGRFTVQLQEVFRADDDGVTRRDHLDIPRPTGRTATSRVSAAGS